MTLTCNYPKLLDKSCTSKSPLRQAGKLLHNIFSLGARWAVDNTSAWEKNNFKNISEIIQRQLTDPGSLSTAWGTAWDTADKAQKDEEVEIWHFGEWQTKPNCRINSDNFDVTSKLKSDFILRRCLRFVAGSTTLRQKNDHVSPNHCIMYSCIIVKSKLLHVQRKLHF